MPALDKLEKCPFDKHPLNKCPTAFLLPEGAFDGLLVRIVAAELLAVQHGAVLVKLGLDNRYH